MNMSTRDKQRARKFANCTCKFFIHKLDYTECTNCGFKRTKDRTITKVNKKLSKRDQLVDKD